MLYRLPSLFSISFYVVLLLAQIVLLRLAYTEDFFDFYHICLTALNDLTSFFFIFILSNIFFYQNKIYFYIRKNKLRVMALAVIFVIIYLVIEYLLLQLSTLLFLSQFTYIYHQYNNSNVLDSYAMVYSWIKIATNLWLFICIGLILYCVMKFSRRFFATPLIDSLTQSYQQQLMGAQQLSSQTSEQDRRKFYAIIFSSVFCCVINGLVWNFCFNLLSSIDEVKVMISDYYVTIFIFSFVSLGLNYIFLYYTSQKFIRTRNWLPISGLLTASGITVVLFSFLVMLVLFFIMPLFLAFNSIVILLVWFIICYVLLYFLTKFTLRRYLA